MLVLEALISKLEGVVLGAPERDGRSRSEGQHVSIGEDADRAVGRESVGVPEAAQRGGRVVDLHAALHLRHLLIRCTLDQFDGRRTLLDVVGKAQPAGPVLVEPATGSELEAQ